MDIDYYEQDLANGGHKKTSFSINAVFEGLSGHTAANFADMRWTGHRMAVAAKGEFPHPRRKNQFFFGYPQEHLIKRLKSEKIFGGYVRASWEITQGVWMPYVSTMWLPKLAGVVNVDVNGNVYVGDYKSHYGWLTGYSRNMFSGIKHAFAGVIQQVRNMDREGYPRDPVSRNTNREEWVEKTMHQLGFSRSNYKTSFEERFPYINVGTIGHRDVSQVYISETLISLIKDFLRDNC